jgi:hypothetical protein
MFWPSLKQNPDRYFFLVHDATIQEAGEPERDDAVWCGLVKFVSKDGVLVNKRFTFK